eukprot:gene9672-biopygen12249
MSGYGKCCAAAVAPPPPAAAAPPFSSFGPAGRRRPGTRPAPQAGAAGACRPACRPAVVSAAVFPGAQPGAQIRASRRAPAPTRRAVRARGGGGWDGRLVQLFNDGLRDPSRSFLASGLAGTESRHVQVSQCSQFVTGRNKRPGNSGLRTAIRTAARARSGRANDTHGLWE